MKLTTVETFTGKDGVVWSYESNGMRHQVVRAHFGKKTRNSTRDTWTRFLMISGPVTWEKVLKDWECFKKSYRQ